MLIQTGKAQKVPIVCLGHDFWDPLDNWLRREVCQRFEAINVRDTKLYTVVDSAEEALALVKDSKERTIF
jgi:predicted Rossmann-fold nucleotide-binding protein